MRQTRVVKILETRAALCAGRGTAFAHHPAAAPGALKAASRGIPLAAALQIFSSHLRSRRHSVKIPAPPCLCVIKGCDAVCGRFSKTAGKMKSPMLNCDPDNLRGFYHDKIKGRCDLFAGKAVRGTRFSCEFVF
jgi:hypothetical protein